MALSAELVEVAAVGSPQKPEKLERVVLQQREQGLLVGSLESLAAPNRNPLSLAWLQRRERCHHGKGPRFGLRPYPLVSPAFGGCS